MRAEPAVAVLGDACVDDTTMGCFLGVTVTEAAIAVVSPTEGVSCFVESTNRLLLPNQLHPIAVRAHRHP